MESERAELKILWEAYLERFSGRRLAATLSVLLIPLIGVVGWVVDGPALGITSAAGVLACFLFLVAFAMAHREVTSAPASPPQPAAAADTATEHSTGASPPGSAARFAG